MAHRNARLTEHGRRLLVERVRVDQRPVAHVAKELGVSRQCAHRWARRMFGSNVVVGGVIVPSAVNIPYYPELNPENGGNFSQAKLGGADFRKADLRNTDLSRAGLAGSDLRGADLRGADLSQAVLDGANLTGAKMNDTNLGGLDLIGANLTGANFGGTASLLGAKLSGAIWKNTTCPDGHVTSTGC